MTHNNKKKNILLTLIIVIKLTLVLLDGVYNLNFLFLNFNQLQLDIFSNILIISICLFYKTKKKMFIMVIKMFIILTLLYSIITSLFLSASSKYYYFVSPNKINKIVIEEEAWLHGGWSNVYEVVNPVFIRSLPGNIRTDDGYRPFTQNEYKIEWKNDFEIIIKYNSGISYSNYCSEEFIID